MHFKPLHHNHNVADMARSLAFYQEALGLTERRRIEAADGSYTIVFLGVPGSDMEVELTSLQDHPGPYALGDNEQHIGFRVDDFNAAHALHERMGCICYENPAMGIYFIVPTATGWRSSPPGIDRQANLWNPPPVWAADFSLSRNL